MNEFILKSPTELKEMLNESGINDLTKMKDIFNYIDNLQKQLLNYQLFLDFIEFTSISTNANVKT